MSADRPPLAEQLDLAPHPEGGWFRRTWASPIMVDVPGYDGPRPTATAIYFLLNPGEHARWHVVRSTELWLWQAGGALALRFGGTGDQPGVVDTITVGPDLPAGQQLQAVVPGGWWQAAAPAGDEAVLVSCVVSPGFDFADWRLAALC